MRPLPRRLRRLRSSSGQQGPTRNFLDHEIAISVLGEFGVKLGHGNPCATQEAQKARLMFNACVTILPKEIDFALTAALFEDDEPRGRNGKVHCLIDAALPALRDSLERKIILANRTARSPRLCAVVLKRIVEPRRNCASSGALVFMRLADWIANNPGARPPLPAPPKAPYR